MHSSLAHNVKRRVAKASTRDKTIKDGISAEYTDLKSSLTRLKSCCKAMVAQIDTNRQAWVDIVARQNEFSDLVSSNLPMKGPMRAHADDVARGMHRLQLEVFDSPDNNAPHRALERVLTTYISVIESLESEYSKVETEWVEIHRYGAKVDKLAKGKKKRTDKLRRNMDKLAGARATYDTLLGTHVERMNVCFAKHEVVMQCAQCAFWLTNDKYATLVDNHTRAVRLEATTLQDSLLALDITSDNIHPVYTQAIEGADPSPLLLTAPKPPSPQTPSSQPPSPQPKVPAVNKASAPSTPASTAPAAPARRVPAVLAPVAPTSTMPVAPASTVPVAPASTVAVAPAPAVPVAPTPAVPVAPAPMAPAPAVPVAPAPAVVVAPAPLASIAIPAAIGPLPSAPSNEPPSPTKESGTHPKRSILQRFMHRKSSGAAPVAA